MAPARASLARLGSSLALALVIGCGTDAEPMNGTPDSGVVSDRDAGPPPPPVEIGTGIDGFVPIVEDELLPLQVGPQGGGRFEGYHIFSAVRVNGMSPTNLLATFRILSEDRTVQAEQARQFRRLQPEGSAFVAFAVAPRLMDCCAIENQTAYLTVEVMDEDGMMGSDERRIIAGPICEDAMNPGASLCP